MKAPFLSDSYTAKRADYLQAASNGARNTYSTRHIFLRTFLSVGRSPRTDSIASLSCSGLNPLSSESAIRTLKFDLPVHSL